MVLLCERGVWQQIYKKTQVTPSMQNTLDVVGVRLLRVNDECSPAETARRDNASTTY
jgi:hypothetical protein